MVVGEEDGVSVRLRREVDVLVLSRRFVDDGFLLGSFPRIHFHVPHHAHGLICGQDDSTVIDIDGFLHADAEQVGRSQFGQRSLVFRHAALRSAKSHNDPMSRFSLAVPTMDGLSSFQLAAIYFLCKFAGSRHKGNLAEEVFPTLPLRGVGLLLEVCQLGSRVHLLRRAHSVRPKRMWTARQTERV